MNENVPGQVILRKARRQFSREEVRAHIAAQARSGLSVSRYCSENHLAPCLLYAWRRRLAPAQEEASPMRFDTIRVKNLLHQSWAAEVGLASGVLVRFSSTADPGWAGALVARLIRPC